MYRSNCILNEFEALIRVFERIEVRPISRWLEAILSKFVRLDLLPHLCLYLQIYLNRVNTFIFRSDIQYQKETAEFDLGSQNLAPVEHVEYYLCETLGG